MAETATGCSGEVLDMIYGVREFESPNNLFILLIRSPLWVHLCKVSYYEYCTHTYGLGYTYDNILSMTIMPFIMKRYGAILTVVVFEFGFEFGEGGVPKQKC